jgi:Xaa-Pro aminopeptidase
MADVRSIKLDEELDLIRRACQVAWAGVNAVLDQPKHELPLSLALSATANQGATIPSSKPIVRFDSNATIVDIGVIVDLYEGGVGGRFVDGHREGNPHLAGACRDGATHDDLAASAAGRWLVRGLGMGYETPVLDPTRGRDRTLRTGMVLSVTDGDHRDVVAVREGPPDVLSVNSPTVAGS